MDKRSRAYKIFEVGHSVAVESGAQSDIALMMGLAAMIDYATKKPAPKKKAGEIKLEFQVADLLASCGANPDTTPGPLFGRLGKLAKDLGVTRSDIQSLDVYMSNKGREWYDANNVIITAPMVIKKLPDWLSAAREYQGGSVPTNTDVWR